MSPRKRDYFSDYGVSLEGGLLELTEPIAVPLAEWEAETIGNLKRFPWRETTAEQVAQAPA